MNLPVTLLLIWWVSSGAIVGILATWRLAAFLYIDKGPFGKMAKIRNRLAAKPGFWFDQFSCFWCLSLWSGLIISPLAMILWPLLLPAAFSGAAILLANGGRIVWRYMEES